MKEIWPFCPHKITLEGYLLFFFRNVKKNYHPGRCRSGSGFEAMVEIQFKPDGYPDSRFSLPDVSIIFSVFLTNEN
ncbi:MAG: hypothetical protein ACPLPQ_03425 [Candidatus Saccharicenans sp.]